MRELDIDVIEYSECGGEVRGRLWPCSVAGDAKYRIFINEV
jgi:hypothetical protein